MQYLTLLPSRPMDRRDARKRQEDRGNFSGLKLSDCLKWVLADITKKNIIDHRPFCSSKLRECFIEMILKRALKDKMPNRDLLRDFYKSLNRLYGGAVVEILDGWDLQTLMNNEFSRVEKEFFQKRSKNAK